MDTSTKNRLKALVDISKINRKEESIIIVDEADDVIMKNPSKFVQAIKGEKT